MEGLFRGPGGGVPSVRKVCIFLQKKLNFRPILTKINAFKSGIETSSAKT